MAGKHELDFVNGALAQLTDEEIDSLVRALGDGEHLTGLAQALNVKKPAIAAHPDPAAIVRSRIRSGPPGRKVVAAMELAGPCADDCIAALGPRSDDPTTDDMVEVLPDLVARWGAHAVTLMLAGYVGMDAPCAAVFADLLEHDERFLIGAPAVGAPPGVVRDVGSAAENGAHAHAHDTDDGAKRARRKEADARKKEAARKARVATQAAAAALKAARRKKT